MPSRKPLLVAALGSSLALAAGAAAAQEKPDFVFNVPVNLRAMHPEIKPNSLLVMCRVLKEQARVITAENEIATSFGGGREYTRVPVDAGGNFSGTVRVNAYTHRGKNAADGKFYMCDLWIDGHAAEGRKGAHIDSKAGTPRAVRVSGPIR